MATTTKMTKAMLVEELEKTQDQVSELELKLVNLERYEQYETMAGETFGVYESFVNAGFTQDMAFTLTAKLVEDIYRDKTRTASSRVRYRY